MLPPGVVRRAEGRAGVRIALRAEHRLLGVERKHRQRRFRGRHGCEQLWHGYARAGSEEPDARALSRRRRRSEHHLYCERGRNSRHSPRREADDEGLRVQWACRRHVERPLHRREGGERQRKLCDVREQRRQRVLPEEPHGAVLLVQVRGPRHGNRNVGLRLGDLGRRAAVRRRCWLLHRERVVAARGRDHRHDCWRDARARIPPPDGQAGDYRGLHVRKHAPRRHSLRARRVMGRAGSGERRDHHELHVQGVRCGRGEHRKQGERRDNGALRPRQGYCGREDSEQERVGGGLLFRGLHCRRRGRCKRHGTCRYEQRLSQMRRASPRAGQLHGALEDVRRCEGRLQHGLRRRVHERRHEVVRDKRRGARQRIPRRVGMGRAARSPRIPRTRDARRLARRKRHVLHFGLRLLERPRFRRLRRPRKHLPDGDSGHFASGDVFCRSFRTRRRNAPAVRQGARVKRDACLRDLPARLSRRPARRCGRVERRHRSARARRLPRFARRRRPDGTPGAVVRCRVFRRRSCRRRPARRLVRDDSRRCVFRRHFGDACVRGGPARGPRPRYGRFRRVRRPGVLCDDAGRPHRLGRDRPLCCRKRRRRERRRFAGTAEAHHRERRGIPGRPRPDADLHRPRRAGDLHAGEGNGRPDYGHERNPDCRNRRDAGGCGRPAHRPRKRQSLGLPELSGPFPLPPEPPRRPRREPRPALRQRPPADQRHDGRLRLDWRERRNDLQLRGPGRPSEPPLRHNGRNPDAGPWTRHALRHHQQLRRQRHGVQLGESLDRQRRRDEGDGRPA